MTPAEIAARLDHSLLSPVLTAQLFEQGCDEAVELSTAALCVRSAEVAHARRRVGQAKVKLCAVIGFPQANTSLAVTRVEAKQALSDGATELDLVLDLTQLKSAAWQAVEERVSTIQSLVAGAGAALKVILETGALTPEEKRQAALVCHRAGVAFVKTSTGFFTLTDPSGRVWVSGASEEDVSLLVSLVRPRCEVKASGGIRSLAQTERFLALGATRIGTSSSRAIVEAARLRESRN